MLALSGIFLFMPHVSFIPPWNYIFAHANKVWNIFFELFLI
jgi:hypothetical protein